MIKFLLASLLSVQLFAAPSWFYKLQDENANVYIGYGVSSSGVKAKQEALNDIASQIFVSVDNSINSQVSDVNGHVSSVNESKSSQKSFATLSDYKLLKFEYKDGEYYVALSYENIPSLDKFVRKVQQLKPSSPTTMMSSNKYLQSTFISKELQRKIGRKIDFELVRKDKKWFIKHKSVMQVLDAKDFSKFFTTKSNSSIKLKTNKKNNILHDGDKFYFEVMSKEDGYVTLLDVYEDGTVAVLMSNIVVKKARVEKMPDEEFESVPEATLLKNCEETYDLYIAVFSKKRLTFESFAEADDDLISEEKYKNFDTLIGLLDEYIYTTLKVVTKPR